MKNVRTIRNIEEIRDILVEELMNLDIDYPHCPATIVLSVNKDLEGRLDTYLDGNSHSGEIVIYRYNPTENNYVEDYFGLEDRKECEEFVNAHREDYYEEEADRILAEAAFDIELEVEEIESES